MLSIGLMSGTSMDGIDAALIETDGTPNLLKQMGSYSLSYDPCFTILLKAAEHSVRRHQGNLNRAHNTYADDLNTYITTQLDTQSHTLSAWQQALKQYLYGTPLQLDDIQLQDVLQHSTTLHAQTVQALLKKTHYQASDINVVGYHGQALFHQPQQKISVVVGDGAALAQQLNITVVNDFRSQDVAAGGQGAPFAPLYHQALSVRDQKSPMALINCGGIANLTLITGSKPNDLIGFDTGPGNALIDNLVRKRTGEQCDHNGQYGARATLSAQQISEFLGLLYQKAVLKDGHNYFDKTPPKSLDYGDLTLISELEALSLVNACKVLEVFTADTIVHSLSFLEQKTLPRHWVLAGGGWHNPIIKQALTEKLTQSLAGDIKIETADEAGWCSQSMEAEIFAYLAVRSLNKQPLSFPSTTGVPQPMLGGQHYLL